MNAPLHTSYDTIVIGAGPAGSIAAYQIARTGKSVLLLDRSTFPRAKVCGCCVAQSGTNLLHSIELSRVLDGATTIRKATIRSGQTAATIQSPTYHVLSREALDSRLALAAQSTGAETVYSASARVTVDGNVQISGVDRPLSARTIIVADGLGGTALADHPAFRWRTSANSRMGVGATLDRSPLALDNDEIAMFCSRNGYLGLVRLPCGKFNAAAALDPNAVRTAGGPAALCEHILISCGVPPNTIQHSLWRGTPLLTRTRSNIESGNIFVLGDAAGYVEPFTGEGMTWAIQSAIELSRIVIATLESRIDMGAWTAAHHVLLAKHHRRCRFVAHVIRNQLLLKIGIVAINHFPLAASFASNHFMPTTSGQFNGQGVPA